MKAFGTCLVGLFLLPGSPARAGIDWNALLLGTALSMSSKAETRTDSCREGEPLVDWSRDAGRSFGGAIGLGLGIPTGVLSFPVWLGIAAARQQVDAQQAFVAALYTGGAVYGACSAAGGSVFTAPFRGLQRLSRPAGEPSAETRERCTDPLPASKLRP